MHPIDNPTAGTAGTDEPGLPEERLAAAREALAARDRLLAERGRRLLVLEDAADRLTAATARVEELSAELETVRLARRAELATRDARIAELEATLVSARQAAQATPPADDLKRIKGIGPRIEGLLHGIGITTFRQIADLSAEDRGRVGELLGVFAGCIERDEWGAQARALAGAVEPEPSG